MTTIDLSEIAEMLIGDSFTVILCHEPHPCTRCQVMRTQFINRNAATACVICDEEVHPDAAR